MTARCFPAWRAPGRLQRGFLPPAPPGAPSYGGPALAHTSGGFVPTTAGRGVAAMALLS